MSPPTRTTGKALHYLHNEWDKPVRYLDDGRLEIDNNLAEFGAKKRAARRPPELIF